MCRKGAYGTRAADASRRISSESDDEEGQDKSNDGDDHAQDDEPGGAPALRPVIPQAYAFLGHDIVVLLNLLLRLLLLFLPHLHELAQEEPRAGAPFLLHPPIHTPTWSARTICI